jgi:TonB family protein
MRTLALIAVSACALFGQELAHDSAPHLIKKVEPQYSEEASKAGLAGTVLLQVMVGADGKARDLKVLRGLGLGLDESAVAAVSAWEFAPGTKDGQPVSVQARIEVNFRLLEKEQKDRWRVTRAEFHLQYGSLRPFIEKAVAPHVADGANSAAATATFNVNERGEAVDVHIDKSSDDEWSRDVTDAIGEWKFTPGSENGKPISVSCTMDFARGGYIQ